MKTIETLKTNALAIKLGKTYPTSHRTAWYIENPANQEKDLTNHSYSIHNGLCAFVVYGTIFLVAASQDNLEVLQLNGFKEKKFFVPFSYAVSTEEPLWEVEKWNAIKAEAAAIAKA